jgi:hypothetical protein
MQLTAVAWREHDNEHASLGNNDELLISVGFLHESSNQILLITAFPGGMITMTYGPATGEKPDSTHVLGQFDADGVLEMHEPRPL